MYHLDVGNDDTEAASFSETSGITNLDSFLTYDRFYFTFLFHCGGILSVHKNVLVRWDKDIFTMCGINFS